jgi:hypothetical protein
MMLTGLMTTLVQEMSDDELDALTELINTERKWRWQLRRQQAAAVREKLAELGKGS